MTDKEILEKFIDFKDSYLTKSETRKFKSLIEQHREAISLGDVLGECPSKKIDFKVIDDTPFFVRPFPISEDDKPIMDKHMQRLEKLGAVTENTTSHTSPAMLVDRKVLIHKHDKRPVADFRFLNSRIKRRKYSNTTLKGYFPHSWKFSSRSFFLCEFEGCISQFKTN